MIPSIDTYLKKEVTDLLRIILNECYIIDEVLRDFDKETVTTFKKAYSGKKPMHAIPVLLAFPNSKENVRATYVIELGEGSEVKGALGGVEGTFQYKQKGYYDEHLPVKDDGNRLYFETTEPIGEFIGCQGISFAKGDDLQVEGNRIHFKRGGNEQLIGSFFSVQYNAKYESTSGEDPHGTYRGYTAQERVHITSAGTNIDTVRCLDAILKVILIMLRQTAEEQNYYTLQKTHFSGIAPVIGDGDTVVYGRSVSLSYTVSYSVEHNVAQKIKEVRLREVIKDG